MPLRHIAKVKQNALSEATAIAKMRDGWFELVVAGCQGFEPEEVQVIRQTQIYSLEIFCSVILSLKLKFLGLHRGSGCLRESQTRDG